MKRRLLGEKVVPLAAAAIVVLSRLALAQSPSDPSAAFFNDTVLHEIRLTLNGKDWAALKADVQGSTEYPADFRWGTDVARNVAVQWHGHKRRPSNPSVSIDFSHYTSSQTFRNIGAIVLRNSAEDASRMRERLAMTFFRRLGLPGMREAHTRLFINNEDLGLYTIVETPDPNFLQRNFGESGGHLYEFAFDFAALAVGTPFVFQDLGTDPAKYVPRLFKPETLENDPQGNVVARFMQTVDSNAAGWRTAIGEFVDLPAFIRQLAAENFMAVENGLMGDDGPDNFYIYRVASSNRFQFIPWDKGNALRKPAFSIFRNLRDGPQTYRNHLALRALQEPDLLQRYFDTLLECAATAGNFEPEVDRIYQQIRSVALADTALFTADEFEHTVLDVRAFARGRSASVTAEVGASR